MLMLGQACQGLWGEEGKGAKRGMGTVKPWETGTGSTLLFLSNEA